MNWHQRRQAEIKGAETRPSGDDQSGLRRAAAGLARGGGRAHARHAGGDGLPGIEPVSVKLQPKQSRTLQKCDLRLAENGRR